MFDILTRGTSVNHHFVADCRYGFCARKSANGVQDGFCVRFRVAKNGYFDKLVQIEGSGDIQNLVVAYAVFADLEDWIYLLRHTAKARAL